MASKNYYAQFPILAYKLTTVLMATVVVFAKTLIGKYPIEVIKIAYIIFRNESGNGAHCVNNNGIGLQADCGVWQGLSLVNVTGTCSKIDSGAARRIFLCFNDKGHEVCFDYLCFKIQQRGMYIGAPGVTTVDQVEQLYKLKWVGNTTTPGNAEIKAFEDMYNQGTELLK